MESEHVSQFQDVKLHNSYTAAKYIKCMCTCVYMRTGPEYHRTNMRYTIFTKMKTDLIWTGV